MASSAWAIFHGAKEYMLDGTIDMDDASAGVFKCALITSAWAPSLSGDDTWADISANEVTAANGYSAGGVALTSVTWTNNAGTMAWDAADPAWTASGGSIVGRYAVIYHVASGKLIAYTLLDTTPADVTALTGTNFVVQLHTNGIFQLA